MTLSDVANSVDDIICDRDVPCRWQALVFFVHRPLRWSNDLLH